MNKKVLRNITFTLAVIVSLVILVNYFYPFIDEATNKYVTVLIIFLGMFLTFLNFKNNDKTKY